MTGSIVSDVARQSTPNRWTVRAAIAPQLGEPRIAAPLTSQLLCGATLTVRERRDDWLLVHGVDGYEGWTHVGYLEPSDGTESTWRLSLGCVVREATGETRGLPLGARVRPDAQGISGESIDAEVQALRFPAEGHAIARSATLWFSGASYLWGGVTPWGCDCSGFVQQIFALHGVPLPRDAWQQALVGESIGVDGDVIEQSAPADLLFFSDRDDRRITHVGIALGDGRMVHSALRRGGLHVDQLGAAGEYERRLRAQCVGARRIMAPPK